MQTQPTRSEAPRGGIEAARASLYSEVQTLPKWVFTLVGAGSIIAFVAVAVVMVAASGSFPLPLWALAIPIAPMLVAALVFNLFFMHTDITGDTLTVRFGWWMTLYKRRIPLADIARADAVQYRPVVEYGGWGIRGYPGDGVLNANGDLGVKLYFKNGARLLVGTATPQALARALQQAGVVASGEIKQNRGFD